MRGCLRKKADGGRRHHEGVSTVENVTVLVQRILKEKKKKKMVILFDFFIKVILLHYSYIYIYIYVEREMECLKIV